MKEFLSPPETPKRSKSMSLHPTTDIDTRMIKQIGNYTLGAEVGSGAFGKVVLGKHILTGETVAIKILDKMILSQTPEDYELVRQEISILKIVKHKYIVQLYEILQTPQHIFIIMEYCEGKDLMDYILTKTRLSELESLKFFQQLINALFYLHSQNISHRDVKIDNMLLDRNKDLKLVDFGLSTKYTDDTLLDQPCGTVVYAAPEVLDGNEYHGMLADVWSSGIVLFGMASGYLPFCDQDDEVNKKHVLEGKIDLPDFFSPMLKDLLKHMLDINPITRYTLQDIREHPWFNMNDTNLIPGIIIGYNLIPVDENILNLCVAYNCDRDKIEFSVKNNKYDDGSALYYLLVKKINRKGFESVSDLSSELFIDFILDDNNLVNRERNKRNLKTKDKNNKNKLKDDNSSQINRNNSAVSHRTNTNHDTVENNIYKNEFTPSTLNNKDIVSSSSRHIDDLGAAPRLFPQMNDNKLVKQKGKKDNLLDNNKRKNKVSSAVKTNQYSNKNTDDLSRRNNESTDNKNRLKPKINLFKKKRDDNKNNNIINKKRYNNSAQHRQINYKNLNKNNKQDNNINNNNNNKLKNKQITNNKNNNNNSSIKNNNDYNSNNNNNNNTMIDLSTEIKNNINKEDLNVIQNNENLTINKDDKSNEMKKGISGKIEELKHKENTTSIEEFKSNTEKLNIELNNNNKTKINQNTNKTPIKTSKKSVTRDIRDPSTTTYSAYKDISHKFKKRYEYNNSIKYKNQNIQKKENNKNLTLKNNKENNNSSITNLNKEKIDKNLVNSCIDINPLDYLKTPVSAKTRIKNDVTNNNNKTSCKNINKNNRKPLLEDINKKSGVNTTAVISEKFNPITYNNKTIYNKNKTNKFNHNISKSIHTTYNSRFNDNDRNEESVILFSSNKKKEYSINRKKNHITSIQNLNRTKYDNNNRNHNNSMTTKYKVYARNKMTYRNVNITSPMNHLNLSLNNNTSNKYNRYKYGISSSVPKLKRKKEDYDPNNTIYEFNYKNKNKHRIRLDFNPNKQLTANEMQDKKKKSNLNNSVNIGKADENKLTRLTRYMNNYNRQRTKPHHLESSVITHRKLYSNTIRELSYSPNQKYLNEKTRKERIPWKIKKKGIDDKLTSETIYNRYINKINKHNPLKPYGNKKIRMNRKNLKINRNNYNTKYNSINERTLKSNKGETKILNQTTIENKDSLKHFENRINKNVLNKTNVQYKEYEKTKMKDKKKFKEKTSNNNYITNNRHKAKCLSNEILPPQTHRLKINSEISNTSNLNHIINDNLTTVNNKSHVKGIFAVSNSISVSLLSSKKGFFLNKLNEKMNVVDLSCLIANENNIPDCNQNLVNKLKRNGFNIIINKINKIKASKNNMAIDIDIVKIKNYIGDKNELNHIYFYKINTNKGGVGVNQIISKILFSS